VFAISLVDTASACCDEYTVMTLSFWVMFADENDEAGCVRRNLRLSFYVSIEEQETDQS